MTGSNIEEIVKEQYREMVKAVPLDSITVSELCRRSNISRKTFYEYFKDKDDLLKQILYSDLTAGTEKLKPLFANRDAEISAPLLFEKMYTSVLEQKDFYTALVGRGHAKTFTYLAMRCFIELHTTLSQLEGGKPSIERDYAARCGAGAGAAVLVKWIRDGMTVPPHELALWMSNWTMATSSVGFR